jgi:hypothetical protein
VNHLSDRGPPSLRCGVYLPTRQHEIMVHSISLGGALLLVVLALLLWWFFGPLALLVLVVAALLFWYAFGPGARSGVIN